MNITERDRLAGALIALRPDWGQGAVDKVKRVRTWLSENAMEWSYRDAVVRMTVCAIDTSTVTPARALTDGPWSTIARTLASNGTPQPPTDAERGVECAVCGIRRAYHAGIRASLEHGPHDWQPAQPVTAASPAAIEAAHRSAFNRQETQNAH